MIAIEQFFPQLAHFAHSDIFAQDEWAFEPLKELETHILKLIEQQSAETLTDLEGTTVVSASDPAGKRGGKGLIFNRWIETASAVHLPALDIWIGEGVFLEPTAIIKGPAIIGAGCEVRQGAYLRGNVLVGSRCVLGHATEIKNSILMDHTECGHFNYIGDSVVGSHVNLGAGSKLANFQFRTPEEKRNNVIREISLPVEGETVATGMQKFGAVVGDHVEVGCNAVVSPGTLIGRDNWVYPNTTLPKGYYAPDTLIGPKERKPKISGK